MTSKYRWFPFVPPESFPSFAVYGEILTCSSGDMVGSFGFARAPTVFWLLLFHITNVTGIRKEQVQRKPEIRSHVGEPGGHSTIVDLVDHPFVGSSPRESG